MKKIQKTVVSWILSALFFYLLMKNFFKQFHHDYLEILNVSCYQNN